MAQYFDRMFTSIKFFMSEMEDLGIISCYRFDYKISDKTTSESCSEALLCIQNLLRKYKKIVILMKAASVTKNDFGTQDALEHQRRDTHSNLMNNNIEPVVDMIQSNFRPNRPSSDTEVDSSSGSSGSHVVRDPKAPVAMSSTTLPTSSRSFLEDFNLGVDLTSTESLDFNVNSRPNDLMNMQEDLPTSSGNLNDSFPDFVSSNNNSSLSSVVNESDKGAQKDIFFCCCRICHISCLEMSIFADHSCRLSTKEKANENSSVSPYELMIPTCQELRNLRKYVCNFCQLEFRSVNRMKYHLSTCKPGPFKCNICFTLHSSRKKATLHKKKFHAGEKCFSCDCGKSFLRSGSLRKHVVAHHEAKYFNDSPEGLFSCDTCPKQFVKKIFLTNHKLRMHELDKKFLCQMCGSKFLTKNTLATHMKIHEEDKKFDCSICSRKFRTKEKLQHHVMGHNGERPYQCSKCDKSFVSQTRLNEHMNRHTLNRRYPCSDCHKSYASAWDVRKHSQEKHNKRLWSVPVIVVPKSRSSLEDCTTVQTDEEKKRIQESNALMYGPNSPPRYRPPVTPFSLHETMKTLNIDDNDTIIT